MRNTTKDYTNDKQLAQHMYKLSEHFIRSCEAANENNKNLGLSSARSDIDTRLYDEYQKHFDYYLVAKTLSLTETRKSNFEQHVGLNSSSKQDRQERAYQWLMHNAVFENVSMWLLDCFYNAYVDYNELSDCWLGFNTWIINRKNSDGTFTFFERSKNPLVVK